jgi:dTDP-glucose 4,6-dehydratase
MDKPELKILLTGTTGFIGSHLVQKLVQQGYDVYALERYVTGRFILGEAKKVKTIFGDLREPFAVRRIVHEVQPSVVIHLASISAVAYSYDHPHEVIETNFVGTVNLVEACLHEVPNFGHFLFASTSETYGNGPIPKTEETPQNPNSPYAVSKLACEKYLFYMRDTYEFPMTILRNFNTYGRKDNTHFVVERTIVQMLKGGPVKLGDPTPTRDFEYVDDHLSSYITCINNPKAKGEAFNFCTGRSVSIKQLVDMISKQCAYTGEIIWNTIPARPLDINDLVGDYSKAKRILRWEPEFTLEKGLESTVKFWKNKLKTFGSPAISR